MRSHEQRIVRWASIISFIVAASVITPLWAGPPDFTVTRSLSGADPSQCESGAVTVTVTGDGSGAPADLLTVVESVPVGLRGNDLVISNVSPGGTLEPLIESQIGVFEFRHVVGDPQGTDNSTVQNPDGSYTSTSNTGRDIWSGGDTFEFGFSQVDGNFDVSIHIDSFDHETMAGCWGKYGLVARHTPEFDGSISFMVGNHGPLGQTNPAGTMGVGFPSIGNDCPGGLGGQSTNIQGRRCAGCANASAMPRGSHIFQSIFGEDPDSLSGWPDGPHSAVYTNFEYLRMTRRGDLFQGWGAEEEDAAAVESDPTNDSNWTEIPIPEHDGGPFVMSPPDNTSCWSVGFGNSDHGHDGPTTQTIVFSVIHWGVGESCTPPTGTQITWTDVPRSDVNAGLSYDIGVAPGAGNLGMTIFGSVNGPEGLSETQGPSEVTAVDAQIVDELKFQGIGGGGGQLISVGPDVFEIQGIGDDIWGPSDHYAYAYRPVSGDFDVVLNVIGRVSSGGFWPKHGLMMRQTCHADSINEAIVSREGILGPVPGAGPRFEYRRGHRMGATTTEPYQVVAGLVPGATDDHFPDFYRLIRTESQVTSYIAWEDPASAGDPFHWCHVGTRNVQDRPEEQFIGIGLSSYNSNSYDIQFTLDVDAYAPATLDALVPGPVVFSNDFESDEADKPPAGAFWGSRATGGLPRSGLFDPVVTDGGRLRMTEEDIEGTASSVWFTDPSFATILDTGFEAQFDVFATKEGLPDPDPIGVLPGDGGMFAVVASASDLFNPDCPGLEEGTIAVEFPDENLGTVIGVQEIDISQTQVDRGGPGPEDDEYTNFNTSGGEIWKTCDRFSYDYTEVTGDFDIVTEIISASNDTSQGQWSKWGLMAREGAGAPGTDDRFVSVHNAGPVVNYGTTVSARKSLVDCVGMSEEPFIPGVNSRFLRLIRRGDIVQGFASDDPELGLGGTLHRNNDCNWTTGPSITLPGLEPTLNVGFFNHEGQDDGVPVLTVVYRILGPNPGGDVPVEEAFSTDLVGFPDQMGLGGGGGNPAAKDGLTGASTCHPHFALEIDARESPSNLQNNAGSNNEGAGAPTNTGQYHVGVNAGGFTDSRQTNEDFGFDAEDLPDIFAAAGVHMRVVYRPNGEIEVFASTGAGGEDPVINTYIPPLTLGAGLAEPIIGFVASNTVGGSQTLEFDNLTIRALQPAGGSFKRGDGDASGTLNINDPIFNLIFQFLGGVTPVCKDALDTDDSGTITINDPIISLTFQFLGGVTIPLPGPDACGPDPTMDNEDCAAYPPDKC